MNPLLSGISAGALVAAIGFAIVWPALGKDFNAVFGRVVGAFLLKLAAVVAGVLAAYALAGREAAGTFATGLLGAYLPLLLLSLAPLRRRLDRIDRTRAETAPADGAPTQPTTGGTGT